MERGFKFSLASTKPLSYGIGDDFDYRDTSEEFKRLTRERTHLPAISYAPDRNLVEDVFAALQTGTVDSYAMILKSLDSLGLMDARPELYKIKRLKDRVTWDDPSQATHESEFRRSVYSGVSSAVTSVLAGLPGMAVGGLIGGVVGGVPGAVVGAAKGRAFTVSPVFGLSQYYDVMEEGREAGIPMHILKHHAIAAGAAEGGLELASNLLFNRIMGFHKVTPTKELIRALSKKPGQRFVQDLARNIVLVAAEEIPTEMAQEWAGIKIRESAGIPVGYTAEEAMREVVGPTIVSSTIFALAGMAGSNVKRKAESVRLRMGELAEKIKTGQELTYAELQEVKEFTEIQTMAYEKFYESQLHEMEGKPTLTEELRRAFTRDPLIPELKRVFDRMAGLNKNGEVAINDLLHMLYHIEDKKMGSEANNIAIRSWFREHFPEVELTDDVDMDVWASQLLDSDRAVQDIVDVVRTLHDEYKIDDPTTESGKEILNIAQEIGKEEKVIPQKDVDISEATDKDAVTAEVQRGIAVLDEVGIAENIPSFDQLQELTGREMVEARRNIIDNYRVIEPNLNDDQKSRIEPVIEKLEESQERYDQKEREREAFFAERGMKYRGEESGLVYFDDESGSSHTLEAENVTQESFDEHVERYKQVHGIDLGVKDAQEVREEAGTPSIEEGLEGRPEEGIRVRDDEKVGVEAEAEEIAAQPGVETVTKPSETAASAKEELNDLNPTGGIFANYTPEQRAKMPLGENITTLDKTMDKSPDEVITIYRGASKGQKEIVAGDYVTTNKQLAKDYAGDGEVIEKNVKLSDILDDKTEPLGEEYIYKPQGEQIEEAQVTPQEPGIIGETETEATGEIPPPETPRQEESATVGGEKISQFRLNTIERDPRFQNLLNRLPKEAYGYRVKKDSQVVREAYLEIDELGVDAVKEKLMNMDALPDAKTAHQASMISEILIDEANKTGNDAELLAFTQHFSVAGRETARALRAVGVAFPKMDSVQGALNKAHKDIQLAEERARKKDPAVDVRINKNTQEFKKQRNKLDAQAAEKVSQDESVKNFEKKVSKQTPEAILAQKIIKHVKPKNKKETTLIKAMINELFGIAKESPIETVVPEIDPMLPISTAMKNSEKYSGVYEKAKAIVLKEFDGNREMLNKLERYFESGAIPPFTRAHLSRAIQKSAKDIDLDLGQIARTYYQQGLQDIQTLKDYIVEQSGLNEAQAEEFSKYVLDGIETMVGDRKKSILKQMFQPRKYRRLKGTAERVNELINLGAYDDKAIVELMKLKEGIPTLSEDDVKFIRESMTRALAMPEGYQRWQEMDKVGQYILKKLPEEHFLLQVLNVPRSLMASFDLSAPFRQGLFLISKPGRFFSAFPTMIKSFFSEDYFNSLRHDIDSHKYRELAHRDSLALTELNALMHKREESFQSPFSETLPLGLGPIIRASSRAYAAFLNKLRLDVYSDMIDKAVLSGLDPINDSTLGGNIARFINSATGRGDLGAFEKAATVLNTYFFSPRLMKSRFDMLNLHYYAKLDSFTRKEAMKTMLANTALFMTTLSLASLAGADTEPDPRNADFGKLIIGNTRLDIAGGMMQYYRIGAQLLTGKIVSSTSGRTMVLNDDGSYRPMTRLDIISRFFENKQSPVFSFITNFMRGDTTIGEPFIFHKELMERFVPMVIQDIVDIKNENPNLLPLGALAIVGFGMQTYPAEPRIVKKFNYRYTNLEQIARKYKKLADKSPEKARDFAKANRYELLEYKKMKKIENRLQKIRRITKKTEESDLPDEKKMERLEYYRDATVRLLEGYYGSVKS